MRNLIFSVVCLIGFTLPVLADTTPDGRPILYCPNQIECNQDRKLDSCHMSNNPFSVWRITSNEGLVVKGIYKLKHVISLYQVGGSPQHTSYTFCKYNLIDNQQIEKFITVNLKFLTEDKKKKDYVPNSFEASLSGVAQWSVIGWNAECLSDNPKSCPLVEFPEIALDDTDVVWGRVFYWNKNGGFASGVLSYEKLLDLCGATNVCKINIGEHDGQDRDGTMKFKHNGVVTLNILRPDIVTIVSIDTAATSSCTLKKKEPFNTIYCEPNQKAPI
ncbi:hypothetical protein OQJ19_12645 [Fluoribacter gormanii]|uniref:hypothetical protein n=1 Tax=Fluoribacter gormanii TaxID=464 RepID=UPI002242C785|nr:hypothetical protein [Fluoribacter gormanii]MCW8471488.1 hypothetical protein [Fluoribacter gormanii]